MPLTKDRISSPQEALAFMTESTLATIERLADMKRSAKFELTRQITIAQIGVDWCKATGSHGLPRLSEILEQDLSVAEWARK